MFRFSIRELMLVTLVVGMLLAWRLDHWRLAQQAELAERFSDCSIALARRLENHGEYITLFACGIPSLDIRDASLPLNGFTPYLGDEEVLWEPESLRQEAAEYRRRNTMTP
jgi:hypothetical protein